MSDTLSMAAISLAWLAAIFVPVEWALPAWAAQRRFRPGFATDLAFFAGQHLLFGACAVWVLTALSTLVEIHLSGHVVRDGFGALPIAGQAALALILGDLLVYWGHRLQHRSNWLWRFHCVHHTAERLDFMAAHREHPLDGIYTQALMNLPAIVLGMPVEAVMGLVVFRGLWAIFIHANVRVPLGPFRLLVGSPQLHHWHHAKQRDAGNYANLAPWIDWLFGTYHRPERPPTQLGIQESHPKTYLALLVHPFRRRARS